MSKTHVLYLTQYYLTAAEAGGQRHCHHVEHLLDQGYRVTVVSSYVHYQTRRVPPEYAGRRAVTQDCGDLKIVLTYAYPGYGRDLMSRLRNYLSFTWHALRSGAGVKGVDLVLISSPPLFLGITGWLLSRWRRVPLLLEVRDLWPETAVAMGFVTNPLIIRPAEWLERSLYRSAAHILALTEGIRDGIMAKGAPAAKVDLIPNAADLDLFPPPDPRPAAHPLVRAHPGEFVAVYAGVHSTYSALHTLVHAARLLRDTHPLIRIVLVGDGDSKPGLVKLARELDVPNLRFVDQQPKTDIPAILAAADCCVLPYQKLELFRGALPNKTFDYLAAGRPIVAAVLPGELTRLLETAGAGLAVPPEDPAALARALAHLAEHPEDGREMGIRGRAYVQEQYDRRTVLARYGAVIREVMGR